MAQCQCLDKELKMHQTNAMMLETMFSLTRHASSTSRAFLTLFVQCASSIMIMRYATEFEGKHILTPAHILQESYGLQQLTDESHTIILGCP